MVDAHPKYPTQLGSQTTRILQLPFMGIIQSQKNLTQAEKHFKAALKLGLSMNHDLAMAKMSLAGIYLQKRRKREAQQLLTEAKKLDKHGMLKGQMKMIQQQMKKI